MDIYGLQNDSYAKHRDALYLMERSTTKKLFYKRQAVVYLLLYEICSGWAGNESPEEYIKLGLWGLSDYKARKVRAAIVELGYSLKRGKWND
jgi:hypothetical protein